MFIFIEAPLETSTALQLRCKPPAKTMPAWVYFFNDVFFGGSKDIVKRKRKGRRDKEVIIKEMLKGKTPVGT